MDRKNILKALDEFPLDDEVKFKAQEIFSRLDCGIYRKNNRRKILFYCVYMAHKELDKHCIPLELAKVFNLKQGDLQKFPGIFFSEFSSQKNSYSSEELTFSYIRKFALEFSFTPESLEDLLLLAKQVIKKDPSLLEEHPNTLASGFLMYYMKNHGVKLKNKNELKSITNRSITTIEKIYKKILHSDV